MMCAYGYGMQVSAWLIESQGGALLRRVTGGAKGLGEQIKSLMNDEK